MADATLRLDGTEAAPRPDDVARAHAEAALAIAYELRTRNNIALLDLAVREGWAHEADGRTLRMMIVEAVDLATLAELVDGTYQSPQDRQYLNVAQAVNAERGRIMSKLGEVARQDGTVDEPLAYIADVVFNKGGDGA